MAPTTIINPLISSNIFGTKIFVSPSTPKKTFPRIFLKSVNVSNNNSNSNSDNKWKPNQAALAALLFTSITITTTPQAALSLVDTPPPPAAPQVIEIDAQKSSSQSPFSQSLILNAPKPQSQSDFPESSQWLYSEFLNAVKKGNVERVRFNKDGSVLQLTAIDGRRASVIVPNDPGLIGSLLINGVYISVSEDDSGNGLFSIIGNLIFPFIALSGLYFLFRRSQDGPGGLGGPMDFGRSKFKFQEVPETGVTFADVAGADQAKLELQEVVDFLKNPDKYTASGAKIPKGCLLVGSPGTGKTLLARAVAGEARAPFFSCPASEFVELLAGVGASRVRDLFVKAKSKAPCIVFIDEIDAFGRQREAGMGGANDEREQTINQLLTEMDGFSCNSGVIVLAATNRADFLDSALLRPGRFDRQVTVDKPDVTGTVNILQVHYGGEALAKDVDFDKIARRTPGFTGADLQNLMNEAAIMAARRDLKEINKDEVADALERIVALMPEYDPVTQISIIPRGQAGGLTFFAPSEERLESGLYSRSYLENQMSVALGGRVAEEVIFGKDNVTTGASNDFMQVSRVARQMVVRFGFSKKIGQIVIGWGDGNPFPGNHQRHNVLISSASSQNSPFTPTTTTTTITDEQELDQDQYDVARLPNPHYDFTSLLEFLSNPNYSPDSAQLDPVELRLAESYRAVPAPLWHSLIKNLSSSPSSFSTAYSLVTWLQKHNICFSYELLYSILIHALGRNEKLYEAFLLSQLQSLTPVTYNALIGACARNNDLDKALSLMERMRRDGYHSDFVNYSLVIQSLMRNNVNVDVGILEKLYCEMQADGIELDCQLFNDMVLGFSKAGDVDRAFYFLGLMQGNGLSPKMSTLLCIIYQLGSLGRVEEAEAIFEELKEGGLKPRTRAYNALLRGYVKVGALKDAEIVVTEMEETGVLPDEQTYSLLIDAYGNAGRWDSARIVLKEMEANNVKPNSYVFSRILASYRDRGEWQRSFQVLKEMNNCGVSPDRQFYNIMIDTFGKYNCLEHMMAAFDRMKLEEIEPDTVTWNTLIDCHCKQGRYGKSEELFEEMQKSGCFPCTTTYNIMINSFGAQERWNDVNDLLGKMRSQGLLPNVVTYTTLVDIYGQSGRFNEAIECLEAMKSAGLKPSSTMYNALINAYAQRGLSEQAVNAFRVMRGDGLKPSLLALNSLINAFGEDRRDTEAFSVLQYMKDNYLKPDVVTYTTLMKALIRVEKFDKVPAVFEEMLLSGCAPDRKARAMLRSALRYLKSSLML